MILKIKLCHLSYVTLEHHGKRNKPEIAGIPDYAFDPNMEQNVIEIVSEIHANVSSSDIEECHRVGKSKNSSKKSNCTIH